MTFASPCIAAALRCAWALCVACSPLALAFQHTQELSLDARSNLSALHDELHISHDEFVAIRTKSALKTLVVQGGDGIRWGFHEMSWDPVIHKHLTVSPIATRREELFVAVTSNETTVTIEIASPCVIVSTYLILFAPLAMAWAMVYHHGLEAKAYLVFLPLTFVAMVICLDLVNQSLTLLINSPMAITAIQALSMVVMCGLWAAYKQWQQPFFSHRTLTVLQHWTLVSALFATFQIVSHEVSEYCSLSERTVFFNLTPVVMLIAEVSFLPSTIKTHISFSSKMALAGMVLGTIVFALQYPDFTIVGLLAATGMVVTQVPYRFFQRWYLAECFDVPVPMLAMYDGLVLFIPSAIISDVSQDAFWNTWETWFSDSSIALLLVLSMVTFVGVQVSILLMLRATSATGAIVFHSCANVIMVILGVVFFGDDVLSTLTLIGMSITLCCGMWYAADLSFNSEGSATKDKMQEGAENLLVSAIETSGASLVKAPGAAKPQHGKTVENDQ